MERLHLANPFAPQFVGEPPLVPDATAYAKTDDRKRPFSISVLLHLIFVLLAFLSSFTLPGPPQVPVRFPYVTLIEPMRPGLAARSGRLQQGYLVSGNKAGNHKPSAAPRVAAAAVPWPLARLSQPPRPIPVVVAPPAIIQPTEPPKLIGIVVPPPPLLSNAELSSPTSRLGPRAKDKVAADRESTLTVVPKPGSGGETGGSDPDSTGPALTVRAKGTGTGREAFGSGTGAQFPGVSSRGPRPGVPGLPAMSSLSLQSRHPRLGNDIPLPQAPSTHGVQFVGPLPQPEYPQALRDRGVQGIVKLRVLFQADGKVQILGEPDSPDPGLTAEAVAAILKATFVPASRNGKAIDQMMTITAQFNIARKITGDLSAN